MSHMLGAWPDRIAATVASCFEPPQGQDPYDYVFDFTGEIQWDRSEAVCAIFLAVPA